MKIAPLFRCLEAQDWAEPVFVDAGQHKEPRMSSALWESLSLPSPQISLDVAEQSRESRFKVTQLAYESACARDRPDFVVVVGDVDCSLAVCRVAKSLGIPVGHVEAGLRGGPPSMPEERNRKEIDGLSDLLWASTQSAFDNLTKEGRGEQATLVGNVMIDSLLSLPPGSSATPFPRLGLVTLHRAENVDPPRRLGKLVSALREVAPEYPFVFPVHPRTQKRLKACHLWAKLEHTQGVTLTAPFPYPEFIQRLIQAPFAITDSGGVQEEASFLGVPVLVPRQQSERSSLFSEGNPEPVELDALPTRLEEAVSMAGGGRRPRQIPFWDGQTASRICSHIRRYLGESHD